MEEERVVEWGKLSGKRREQERGVAEWGKVSGRRKEQEREVRARLDREEEIDKNRRRLSE